MKKLLLITAILASTATYGQEKRSAAAKDTVYLEVKIHLGHGFTVYHIDKPAKQSQMQFFIYDPQLNAYITCSDIHGLKMTADSPNKDGD